VGDGNGCHGCCCGRFAGAGVNEDGEVSRANLVQVCLQGEVVVAGSCEDGRRCNAFAGAS